MITLLSRCKPNWWISKFVAIVIQVMLVYIALNLLYFTLAVSVEKSTFGNQIELITQSIMDELKPQLAPLLYQSNQIDRDKLNVAVAGLMDTIDEKIKLESVSANESVNKRNADVRKNAIQLVLKVSAVCICIALLMVMLGFCTDWKHSFGEAIWAVFFVVLTEIIFLFAVTARFISADPNLVKRRIGTVIQDWIKANIKQGES